MPGAPQKAGNWAAGNFEQQKMILIDQSNQENCKMVKLKENPRTFSHLMHVVKMEFSRFPEMEEYFWIKWPTRLF